MNDTALAILIHQVVFQGMFFAKNITLRRKLGRPIRGTNREANISIIFFAAFISLAIYFAATGETQVTIALLPQPMARIAGYVLMIASVVVAVGSLWNLGDSWRVGVIEEQKTELVQSGIYRISRNPYFLAYLLMFAAYTLMLQNLVLLGLSFLGYIMIHMMVLREEAYLARVHGHEYRQYTQHVPRYLSLPKPFKSSVSTK